MNRVRILVDYEEIEHIAVADITTQAEFDRMIKTIKEKAPTWESQILAKVTEARQKSAEQKIEREKNEELINLRKGVCNLELCYANGRQTKCTEGGHLQKDPVKGFVCFKWGYKRHCMRVTPTGRISIRKRWAVLDRFKLVFFKEAIKAEVEKVKASYKQVQEEATDKLKAGEAECQKPLDTVQI